MENKKNPKEQSSIKDKTSNTEKSKKQQSDQNLTNQSETWNQKKGKSGAFSSDRQKSGYQDREEEQTETPLEDLDSTGSEDDVDPSQRKGNQDTNKSDREKREPYKGL